MKLNIKGLVFVGFAAAILAGAARAEDDPPAQPAGSKTVTSKQYVDGKIVSTITDGDTTHAPSADKVHDELALKQDIQIGDSGDEGKILVVDNEGKISIGTSTGGAYQAASDTNYQVSDNNGGWTALGTTLDTTDTTNYVAGNAVTAGTIVTALAGKQTASDTNYQVSDNNGGWTALGTTLDTTDTTNYVAGNAVTAGTIVTALGTKVDINQGTSNANKYLQVNATSGELELQSMDTTPTANSLKAVTSGGIYSAINNKLLPSAASCSAAAPCALVATGDGAFSWEPIQQPETSQGSGE